MIEQACLRPRDRFWDIPAPKIDSAFDNLLVPQPSWSPSTAQQLRKLVAAPYLSPNDWTLRSEAYFVFPLAQGTPGKQCGLAATGDYQPSLRSPWLAANARRLRCPQGAVLQSPVLRHGHGNGPGLGKIGQHNHADDGDGHTQKHAGHPPHLPPQGQGQNHHQRTEVERRPHEPRFEHIADQHLHRAERYQQGNKRPESIELHQCQGGRQQHGHHGTDGGNVVEHEDQQRPERHVIHADPQQDDIADDTRQRTDHGLDIYTYWRI
nr:hypothetical protein [Thiolapillus sp.]